MWRPWPSQEPSALETWCTSFNTWDPETYRVSPKLLSCLGRDPWWTFSQHSAQCSGNFSGCWLTCSDLQSLSFLQPFSSSWLCPSWNIISLQTQLSVDAEYTLWCIMIPCHWSAIPLHGIPFLLLLCSLSAWFPPFQGSGLVSAPPNNPSWQLFTLTFNGRHAVCTYTPHTEHNSSMAFVVSKLTMYYVTPGDRCETGPTSTLFFTH